MERPKEYNVKVTVFLFRDGGGVSVQQSHILYCGPSLYCSVVIPFFSSLAFSSLFTSDVGLSEINPRNIA